MKNEKTRMDNAMVKKGFGGASPLRHFSFFILHSSFLISLAAFGAEGSDSFVRKQAYAELQRINGALEVLESNHDSLAARLSRIEGGKGELGAVKSDIESLRAEIASLRREMQNMRAEIVTELTGKVLEINKANQASIDAKLAQNAAAVREAQRSAASSYDGPVREYVVQPGDSLTLIAQAFGTKVATLREMNSLNGDMIRVGQKIIVPRK